MSEFSGRGLMRHAQSAIVDRGHAVFETVRAGCRAAVIVSDKHH